MDERKVQVKALLKQTLQDNLAGVDYGAFIFGSQANLAALRLSDIDVGIIAHEPIPLPTFSRICNLMEDLPMLYKVDLVDFATAEEKFKAVAMKNVEWL